MKSKLSLFASLVGNILEHHDKALFVFLAPFIASQFFPSENSTNSLIQMYGAIALSLFFRPLGALVFGRWADEKGRKNVLVFSLTGVSLATLAIGFLPIYASIGLLAPIFLFVFRSLQSFFLAGEVHNGAIFALEHTGNRFKAFVGSLFESSTMIGIFLASLETYLLASFGVLESHWQWLFILAGSLGLVTLLLRNRLDESKEYLEEKKERFSFKDLLKEKVSLLTLVVTTGFSYATYILSITFINGYLKITTSLTPEELTAITTALSLADMVLLPCFGYLSLFISPAKLMRISALFAAVTAVPFFYGMIQTGDFWAVMAVRSCIMVAGVCFAAMQRAWIQSLFAVKSRCTMINLGSSLGQLLTEGPVTFLSLWMLKSGWDFVPSLFLLFFGLGSFYLIGKVHSSSSVSLVKGSERAVS